VLVNLLAEVGGHDANTSIGVSGELGDYRERRADIDRGRDGDEARGAFEVLEDLGSASRQMPPVEILKER